MPSGCDCSFPLKNCSVDVAPLLQCAKSDRRPGHEGFRDSAFEPPLAGGPNPQASGNGCASDALEPCARRLCLGRRPAETQRFGPARPARRNSALNARQARAGAPSLPQREGASRPRTFAQRLCQPQGTARALRNARGPYAEPDDHPEERPATWSRSSASFRSSSATFASQAEPGGSSCLRTQRAADRPCGRSCCWGRASGGRRCH